MEKLMTVKEVAEYLRLNQETVIRKARRGEIPAIKMGSKSYRFYKEQIDAWLKSKAAMKTGKEGLEAPKAERIELKSYPLGIKGDLSRREIYEGR